MNPSANNIGLTGNSGRLPACAEINKTMESSLAAINGSQRGNPEKGVEIIYDVVTSSGIAEGKELPLFFPLGSDANDEIRKVATKVIDTVEEWREISALSDFPMGQ